MFAEISGAKVNRGAGYGLKVPCVYHLYAPNVYVNKMMVLVEALLVGHYNLCNSDFAQCLINVCGQWLFLEVNLYRFYSLGSWLLVVGRS